MNELITKKRVVMAACLLLAAALGVTGTAGYLAFLRAPANTPAEACGDDAPHRTRPVVVAAGASSTRGTLGGDWVGALRGSTALEGHEFVNAGVNGDTAADLRARIDRDVVACRPAAVTILVGTNDVRAGTPPELYREDLTAIVDRVGSGTTARIALMSLPPLGEDLDADVNRRLAGYNAVVEEVAERAGVDYLPLHEQLVELLGERGGPPYDFSFPLALWAATRHYALGHDWDDVARGGGRELLVDHVHLNDRGAAEVARLVEAWLTGVPAP